ncbi:MAG: tail fiber protein [Muribaculaceae bacterium]|nr:tail fiber protein [Muribaculaceae bacterium]
MKRTTGNFTTQADGQFPLDCETLAMLQENGNIQAIIGNIAGDKVVLLGCELKPGKTERGAGYVFLRTKDYPDGEVIYWKGGSTANGMHIVKEDTQVQAFGASYDAYTSRWLEAGMGEENYNWADFADVKNMREMMKEIADLNAVIDGVHKETSEPLGIVKMWAGKNVPEGYQLCDGSALSRVTYAELYATIGDVFNTAEDRNGNRFETPGEGLFRLPDLRGRFIVGQSANDGDYNTIGGTGGEKEHTLTIAQMPIHSHAFDGLDTDKTGYGASSERATWIGESNDEPAYSTETTGGGEAHENRPPYYVLAYIMRIK